MTHAMTKFLAAFAYIGIAATLMAGGAQSAAPRPDATVMMEPTAAQQAFADAPDGVDPVVTGPVSASFRQQQEALDCGQAVWPNIPMGCYAR